MEALRVIMKYGQKRYMLTNLERPTQPSTKWLRITPMQVNDHSHCRRLLQFLDRSTSSRIRAKQLTLQKVAAVSGQINQLLHQSKTTAKLTPSKHPKSEEVISSWNLFGARCPTLVHFGWVSLLGTVILWIV